MLSNIKYQTLLWIWMLIQGGLLELNAQSAVYQPWPMHVIDGSISGADGVKIQDVNRDGLPDLTTGWEESGQTRIYLHPGYQKVKKPWPVVRTGTTPDVEDALFIDMNSDGFPDIVSASEGDTKQLTIQYHPGLPTPEYRTPWKQEHLPAAAGKMMWMYAQPAQIDAKYGIDVVAAGKGPNAWIGWFAAPSARASLHEWKWYPLSPVGWIMSIEIIDMDRDGDPDILITDRRGPKQGLRWLEHPGFGVVNDTSWNEHVLGATGQEVMFMDLADLNADGIDEILVCERTNQTIIIFKQKQMLARYDQEVIALPDWTGRAKSVTASDLNQDGLKDLIVSTNTEGAELDGLIWTSGGSLHQAATQRQFFSISGKKACKYDRLLTLDLDGDGDDDILTCEENAGENSVGLGVIWYENPTIP